jgi:hypothetical protein
MASNVTTTNTTGSSLSSSSSPGLPFGSLLFPTVVLDLARSNHTGTKCVLVNGLELCSRIDGCPLESFGCETDSQGSQQCQFRSEMCRCSATYGSRECGCQVDSFVGSAEPWVSPIVTCPPAREQGNDGSTGDGGTGNGNGTDTNTNNTSNLPDLVVTPYNLDCTGSSTSSGEGGGQDGSCDSGYGNFNIDYNNTLGNLQVGWECPYVGDSLVCRCRSAVFNYRSCERCRVCRPSADAPRSGAFALECPGFSAECTGTNFTVWPVPESSASAPRRGRKASAAALLPLLLISFA